MLSRLASHLPILEAAAERLRRTTRGSAAAGALPAAGDHDLARGGVMMDRVDALARELMALRESTEKMAGLLTDLRMELAPVQDDVRKIDHRLLEMEAMLRRGERRTRLAAAASVAAAVLAAVLLAVRLAIR